MTTKQQTTYYVLDPKLCQPYEWAHEKLEWPGASVKDAAADAALFWAKNEARDDLVDTEDIDGTSRMVIAATREDGSDARTYEVTIRVEVSTPAIRTGDAVDVTKGSKQ
jgi:hypothetical protein